MKGLIYDVSSNRKTYQPGAGYSCFVGKDAAVLYAKSCCGEPDCEGDYDKLTEAEMTELNSWLEFYHNHGKCLV